jgi:hemolysin III
MQRKLRQQTVGEEVFNSIVHGFGALFGVVVLILLLFKWFSQPALIRLFAYIIYSFSVFFLFMMSTMHHSLTPKKAKHVFLILDHAGIYVMIAGTFTVFALITLANVFLGGWFLFAVMWILAVLGIVMTAVFFRRFQKWAPFLFIAMGWIAGLYFLPLFHMLPFIGFVLLVVGGLCYTIGTPFYLTDKRKYHHAIWHIFVLAGSIVHFITILLWV